MHTGWPILSSREIRAARPTKSPVDSQRPYAFLVEPECSPEGRIENVATIFLTNRECPFTCLMCDLWKNTLDEPVAVGDIPRQIDFALDRLPAAEHIKLYNSGNFFDPHAIPVEDYSEIAARLPGFRTVIVENHPRLCGDDCLRFRDAIDGTLEVALGLETTHPEVLRRLNKQMTLDDFQRAAAFLLRENIQLRTFILLRPPFLSEAEGIDWAMHSIDYAFSLGIRCCSVVPSRAGNGIMEHLQTGGQFAPPELRSMEAVLERGIRLGRGRVFMDLWDAAQFSKCDRCGPARVERMRQMNLTQQV
ncbi:MAG TPA: hypothetical protein VNQ74_13785, partial [Burkholderiaceae bacterium]|nr:hypothetical protein [Burkholderiaceae bacterium]